ncbi:SgcJ/EcaC family oxidoreductase [Erwiniaceae bacterium BAC15a-03b]|uniref:SgcJ/EcaC family oxidoreductase n=1 Tax=Winslowiella arboricola TaxID=2978220 RepID=A0A9J6PQB9_9GAMM|nr:SgcJ/EcaC family oxidoreductase [Winslowiella arboricola]MCU5772101.1 SgcJ/EcaC family oxidoreductase [Winslowiella arboricola]MCU5778563.1 SgcJ/EcaC family oxidoreductase [Winslowiella arboricola]
MKNHIALFLLSASLSASALANDVKCEKADKQQIEGLFDRWNESLKSGDPQKVSENYLSDAVLLPTVSNTVRLTDAERKEYFGHFLEKKPVGKIDSRTIRIGCNKAIDAGTYTFSFKDNTTVSARYTFTYAWNGEKWLISTHHSSAMPES